MFGWLSRHLKSAGTKPAVPVMPAAASSARAVRYILPRLAPLPPVPPLPAWRSSHWASMHAGFPPLPPIPSLPPIPISTGSFQVLVSPSSGANTGAVIGTLADNIFHISANGPVVVSEGNDDACLKLSFGDPAMGWGAVVNIEMDKVHLSQLVCDLAAMIDRDEVTPSMADILDKLQLVGRLSR